MKVSLIVGEAREEIEKPDKFDEDLLPLFSDDKYEPQIEEKYVGEDDKPAIRMITNPVSEDTFRVKRVAAWLSDRMDERIKKVGRKRRGREIDVELKGGSVG